MIVGTAGLLRIVLGIAKEEAPATLPADFFSTKDASATTTQADKKASEGQAQAAERAAELQVQSDKVN